MKRPALFGIVLLLAGCAHGGSAGLLPQAGTPAAGTAAMPSIHFAIKIPKRHGHRSRYVSVSTQSIAVKVYNAAHTVLFSKTVRNVGASSAGCTTSSSATKCAFGITAPSGHDTLDVVTYDLTGGTGHALSAMVDYPITVAKGKKNAVSLTLGGLAASFGITPSNTTQATATASSVSIYGNKPQQLTIYPLDADGDPIVGAGAVTPRIDATPSATTLVASGPDRWTLTSTYTGATNPTIPGNTTLSITATPVPGSGGTTLHKSIALKLYDPWIYVMDYHNRLIYAYDEYGTAKTFNTGVGITYAYGITYAAATNWLYVPDATTGYMHAYDPVGNVETPSASTPFHGLSTPYSVAYDPNNGWMYVANYGGNTVTAYDTQGNTQSTPVWHFNLNNTFLSQPSAIAFDPHNNYVYIANAGNNTAAAYTADGSIQESDQSTTFKNLNTPSGIAFDPNNNFIYISNEGLADQGVLVYNENGVTQTLTGNFTGAVHPGGVAYDPYNGMMYVTNYLAGTITEFDEQGTSKPFNAGKFSGLTNPWGIVVVP